MAGPVISNPAAVDLLDPRSLRSVARDAAKGSPEAVRIAAQQFEAVLLSQLLRQAHKPMFPGGLFDSQAAQSRQEMVDQRLGVVLAQRGGIGLADAMIRQIEASRSLVAATAEAPKGADPLKNVGIRPITG